MKKTIKEFMYFLEFKENKKYNTILSVRNDIEQFLNYFLKNNIDDIKKIDFFMIKEYFNILKSTGVAISTLNRKVSSLKKFYKYLKNENIIIENIILPMENFKSQERNIEYLSDEEIKKLRNTIPTNNFNGIRDKFIFELLYSSGITTSELLKLSEKNFDINERKIEFFSDKKKRVLFFSKRCEEACKNFMKIKAEKFLEKNNINLIFVNNSNERLTDRSLRRIINKYREKANISKEVSPYTIRHTFCIKLLKEGMPKEYLKEMLNMSSVELLNGYEKIIKEEKLWQ